MNDPLNGQAGGVLAHDLFTGIARFAPLRKTPAINTEIVE